MSIGWTVFTYVVTDEMLAQFCAAVLEQFVDEKEKSRQPVEVVDVDRAQTKSIHETDEDGKGALFRHLNEQRGDDKVRSLAISQLGVVYTVGLEHAKELHLAAFIVDELGMGGKCTSQKYDYQSTSGANNDNDAAVNEGERYLDFQRSITKILT